MVPGVRYQAGEGSSFWEFWLEPSISAWDVGKGRSGKLLVAHSNQTEAFYYSTVPTVEEGAG